MAQSENGSSKRAADEQRATGQPESAERPVTAFVSWAHTHSSWVPGQARQWRQTVLDFATALRQIGGIDADIDQWHTANHENWSTFGVSGILQSDFILVAVSMAYRERWEETASPREGAGAAREANVIKGVFDRDRTEFRRRVKLILLPGASIDDIPMELVASTERFTIKNFDLAGLTNLLRSLLGKPEVLKPPLGRVPALPPSYVADVSAAASRAEIGALVHRSSSEEEPLQRRLSQIDEELSALDDQVTGVLSSGEQSLREERETILGSLTALQRIASAATVDVSEAPEPAAPDRDDLMEAFNDAKEAIAEAQQRMRLLPAIAREALFQYFHNGQPLTVGGQLDRFGIEEAVRSEENGYLSWVEDVEQTVSARHEHPRVDAAVSALQRVRSLAFGGISWESRAHAAPWARLLLHDEYGVDDPEFELRPVWVQLGFIDE